MRPSRASAAAGLPLASDVGERERGPGAGERISVVDERIRQRDRCVVASQQRQDLRSGGHDGWRIDVQVRQRCLWIVASPHVVLRLGDSLRRLEVVPPTGDVPQRRQGIVELLVGRPFGGDIDPVPDVVGVAARGCRFCQPEGERSVVAVEGSPRRPGGLLDIDAEPGKASEIDEPGRSAERGSAVVADGVDGCPHEGPPAQRREGRQHLVGVHRRPVPQHGPVNRVLGDDEPGVERMAHGIGVVVTEQRRGGTHGQRFGHGD